MIVCFKKRRRGCGIKDPKRKVTARDALSVERMCEVVYGLRGSRPTAYQPRRSTIPQFFVSDVELALEARDYIFLKPGRGGYGVASNLG